jgi:RNA polymerase sigma-70 factor, ECF subfamily
MGGHGDIHGTGSGVGEGVSAVPTSDSLAATAGWKPGAGGRERPRGARFMRSRPDALSDEELLELVAGRDGDAFEVLYDRYSRAVYSLVARVLRDRGQSEDAVQDAFASVWRAAGGYRRDRGPATAWLFTVARNAAIDMARRQRPLTLAEPQETADPAPQPDAQVASELQAFRVHAAVDGLPQREREAIELAFFSGLSHSEVAERLQLPLGTVKTRIRSGLARLAAVLGGEVVPG